MEILPIRDGILMGFSVSNAASANGWKLEAFTTRSLGGADSNSKSAFDIL